MPWACFAEAHATMTCVSEGGCRGWESNPHDSFESQDFKSCASASFATPACSGVSSLRGLLLRVGRFVPAICLCDGLFGGPGNRANSRRIALSVSNGFTTTSGAKEVALAK